MSLTPAKCKVYDQQYQRQGFIPYAEFLDDDTISLDCTRQERPDSVGCQVTNLIYEWMGK